MSAFPPIATEQQTSRIGSFMPLSDIEVAPNVAAAILSRHDTPAGGVLGDAGVGSAA
jgi:hypothetical protein